MKEVSLKVISTNLTDREITLEYHGSAWLSKDHLMYRENSEPFALISVNFRNQHCTIQRKYENYLMKMELVQDCLSSCSVTTPEGVMQLNVKMKLLNITENQICLEYDLYSFGQVVDQFRKVFSMEV
ncbi:MAG: DUF1934 family protein [Erysipelotrichaceae bacterium]|nr:DUF1934 family protein [Erysipelotrichaceae bacterium]MBQ7888292.1 DUF1934 family protein [Erysipelotrichaceae bacterium]